MRQMTFVWQCPDWPGWRYDAGRLLVPLGSARRAQGELLARVASLGFDDRDRLELEARTDEAVETTEIEGEPVSRIDVRSSIARRLDLERGAVAPKEPPGVVELTLDATLGYAEPLTAARLHRWHATLFRRPGAGRRSFTIGDWRTDELGPMQVVSGRLDAPTVHFEAPPAERVASEVDALLGWLEAPSELDGLVRSALAHLWFLTIHPYDDGNGRIARAIADLALARDERSSRRYFSMSRRIAADRRAYYAVVESTQRGDLDATAWLAWYLASYERAVATALAATDDAIRAHAFWRSHADVALSARQRRVLERYVRGFDGALTTKKWATLAKTSIDTAQRDVADLVAKRVLVPNPGGSKNTSYELAGFER